MNASVGAPIKAKRASIGLIAMNLGKNFIVRKNEKVSNYEPSKQVAMMPLRPLRTTVISFNVFRYVCSKVFERSSVCW